MWVSRQTWLRRSEVKSEPWSLVEHLGQAVDGQPGLVLVLMAWCRASAVCSADGAPVKRVYPATARE